MREIAERTEDERDGKGGGGGNKKRKEKLPTELHFHGQFAPLKTEKWKPCRSLDLWVRLIGRCGGDVNEDARNALVKSSTTGV